MHGATFLRLKAQHDQFVAESLAGAKARFGRPGDPVDDWFDEMGAVLRI
jgi:hypothetical protein